ncbi:MAG: alpha/beta fold hydrolase [Chloroflexi bacterium]|nr:alpha/beta fold hydrolase [Chloroflexota bacterium]
MTTRHRARVAGATAALAVAPFALAWRFAHVYRSRAGYPRPSAPTSDPADFGLPFETRAVRTPDGLELPAWWIPAPGDGQAPVVVLVHGWESARHRTLPNAQFLHALGYHVLTVDIRGHGLNPAETIPVSAGEFGTDALAAVEAALADRRATAVAVLGHSMGSIGAILAAAAEPRVAAAILTATPADPWRLTRQTFRLARLPIPDPIAYPLAWLTTRIYLEPRGHAVAAISASAAARAYRGPVLLIHGSDDRVVPVGHLRRLAAAARTARAGDPEAATVEELVIAGGQHSWLYEDPAYRAAIGRFLAAALGGPLPPHEAACLAASVPAHRPIEPDHAFSAITRDDRPLPPVPDVEPAPTAGSGG